MGMTISYYFYFHLYIRRFNFMSRLKGLSVDAGKCFLFHLLISSYINNRAVSHTSRIKKTSN